MQTVIGIFDNVYEAQKAVQQLKSAGISEDNIEAAVRDENASSSTGSGSSTFSGDTSGNVAPAAAYDHDTDNDSFGDKVSKFFKNLFGNDDDEADRYSHVANKTGCVVTVYAQSQQEAETAADLLDEYGAVDVDERATQYGYAANKGVTGSGSYTGNAGSSGLQSDNVNTGLTDSNSSLDTTGINDSDDFVGTTGVSDSDDYVGTGGASGSGNYTGNAGLTGSGNADESERLHVIREDVEVGKRQVTTGGVRIKSRIVERPVEQQIRLREERIIVERNPVDRPATTADFQNFKEGEIEMTERAEVAQVSKQARVVEEIKLAKEVSERTETVRETARDTQVDIENVDSDDVSRRTSKDIDL